MLLWVYLSHPSSPHVKFLSIDVSIKETKHVQIPEPNTGDVVTLISKLPSSPHPPSSLPSFAGDSNFSSDLCILGLRLSVASEGQEQSLKDPRVGGHWKHPAGTRVWCMCVCKVGKGPSPRTAASWAGRLGWNWGDLQFTASASHSLTGKFPQDWEQLLPDREMGKSDS